MNIKNAVIDKIQTMRDGGVKVTLMTRELSPEQMATLFWSVNKEIDEIEVEDTLDDAKSPAERQRNCLYRLWESQHQTKYKTFSEFYHMYMERHINKIKDQIS